MIFKVSKTAGWLQDFPHDLYDSDNFKKIIDFFVVHSIVEGTSARGKKLDKDYNWRKPWSKPYYLNMQLKDLATDKQLLFSASVFEQKEGSKRKETMDEALDKAELKTFPRYDVEKICVYNSKKNQILSTFAHIRNSFAHCRFNVVDHFGRRVYCFEDVDPKADKQGNVKVTGRIVLFETTLFAWISLIESGEIEYKKKTDTICNLENNKFF